MISISNYILSRLVKLFFLCALFFPVGILVAHAEQKVNSYDDLVQVPGYAEDSITIPSQYISKVNSQLLEHYFWNLDVLSPVVNYTTFNGSIERVEAEYTVTEMKANRKKEKEPVRYSKGKTILYYDKGNLVKIVSIGNINLPEPDSAERVFNYDNKGMLKTVFVKDSEKDYTTIYTVEVFDQDFIKIFKSSTENTSAEESGYILCADIDFDRKYNLTQIQESFNNEMIYTIFDYDEQDRRIEYTRKTSTNLIYSVKSEFSGSEETRYYSGLLEGGGDKYIVKNKNYGYNPNNSSYYFKTIVNELGNPSEYISKIGGNVEVVILYSYN